MQELEFHCEDIVFELENKQLVINWVLSAINKEGYQLGEVSYVFCSDEYLYKINLEHLSHDTYTDIITFNYCENNVVNADIFISIERVKENAKTYSVDFEEELHRVIIHGILHLVGYNDKTDEQQKEMTSREDFYLSLRKK